ncbi:LLM class oxidoreductase [Thalassotalea litorea]|uniref:LLM class oxidoreductase n=1 Tax=Thalassotalea litorea TaxID=2020715 RepID=UPI0037357EF7
MNTNNIATFNTINRGYNQTFQPGKLSIGLVVPIERYENGPVPSMQDHLQKVQLAESLGFSAVWLRDVPFNVPSFGDAGQVFDPFVYLGYLAAATKDIALGVSSIILPLRHPAHVAKAATSADQLSDGRLILGVASGDRPEEYPAMNMSFDDRGERFRESFNYIQAMWETRPTLQNTHGNINADKLNPLDMLPKPVAGKLPLLITGSSQQSPEWAAQNADGWMTYPRNPVDQMRAIGEWKRNVEAAGRAPQPVMQPLYIDLVEDVNARPTPIHLGFRTGVNYLREYLQTAEQIGVNHLALNLRFNRADMDETLKRLGEEILPNQNSIQLAS